MKKFIPVICVALFPVSAGALDIYEPPSLDEIVQLILIPGWAEENRYTVGLEINLAEGWKTYWRKPGYGLPPKFDWSDSRGISGVDVHFPLPKLDQTGGLISIVYENEVILPLQITIAEDNPRLRGDITIGVCDDICVPVNFSIDAPLNDYITYPDLRIGEAQDSRPETGHGMTCKITPVDGGLEIEATLPVKMDTGVLEIPHPDLRVTHPMTDGNTLRARIISDAKQGIPLARGDITVTAFAGGNVIEYRGCQAP